jgi:hypothetical protein
VIGWYIHHVGRGHLHRAQAVNRRLGRPVTGLSSLPRPSDWHGPWVDLAADDLTDCDATAGRQLHWAPIHDEGLRDRMATLSSWIQAARPELLVSDVSVEVTMLFRLHGIPVVSVVLPGDRGDPAHVLGYRLSHALVATWPGGSHDVVRGLPADISRRIDHIGGLSRLEVTRDEHRSPGPPRVVVLGGAGGTTVTVEQLADAQRESPGWSWRVLAPPPVGRWVADPAPLLRRADVVITHAGQNAVAEVAAARRPAVVVPEHRPHGEQEATARGLRGGPWPVTVLDSWPDRSWPRLLAETTALDGATWSGWCDGGAAQRFADVIERTAARLARGPAPA